MNFATSTICQEAKQWGRPMRCIIYTLIGFEHILFVGRESELYTYIGVGLSALLVSTDRGNAKAYRPWNEQKTGSTFFLCISKKQHNINCQLGSRWLKGRLWAQRLYLSRSVFLQNNTLLSKAFTYPKTFHAKADI